MFFIHYCLLYCLFSSNSIISGQDLDFMPVPVRPFSAGNSSVGGEHMQLKQEPRCLEGVEPGTGTDTIARFFYQTTNSSCVPFTYTGNGGNSNNFLSELDCLNNCFIVFKLVKVGTTESAVNSRIFTGVNDEAPQEDEEDVHLIKQDTSRLVKKNSCDNGDATAVNCSSTEIEDTKEA